MLWMNNFHPLLASFFRFVTGPSGPFSGQEGVGSVATGGLAGGCSRGSESLGWSLEQLGPWRPLGPWAPGAVGSIWDLAICVGLFLLICCYAMLCNYMAMCDHVWLKKAISFEFMRMGWHWQPHRTKEELWELLLERERPFMVVLTKVLQLFWLLGSSWGSGKETGEWRGTIGKPLTRALKVRRAP